MPWTSGDVDGHYKGLDKKGKDLWVKVANSALSRCVEKGGDQKECEVSAIRQAASVVKKNLEDPEKSFYYLTDISDIQLEEKEGKKSSWIEIFRIGKWSHPKYGIIEGTTKLFGDFIKNWKDRVLGRDISLDKTHEPSDGATGWIQELKIKGDRLLALIEWTPWGIELIEQKGFKYFSPEYRDSYTDKETGKEYKNVLFGGALTNRPFLTDLAPIILSEDMDIFQKYEDSTLNNELKEELWIALEEYANHDEEKIKNIMNVMKEHMQEMMDEMKTKNGEMMVKSIIKTHMQQIMNEIMNNMDWVKSMNNPNEVKSNY